MGANGLESQAERSSALHGNKPRFASSTVPSLVCKRRLALLQILAKRLIVVIAGEVMDYELNRPFTHLRQMTEGQDPRKIDLRGSDQVRLGASPRGAPPRRRSSASDPSSEEFESSKDFDPKSDLSAFLSGLRFEKRNLLAKFPLDLTVLK